MQVYIYFRNSICWFCILMLTFTVVRAADPADKKSGQQSKGILIGPIVQDDWAYHQIGTLWQRVTNFGFAGDDAYENRTPSCDWPGGSGNSYLYRGTIWLTARIDNVIHSSQADDHEFASIDSVHTLTGINAVRSEEDTYTRYYDVQAPLADGHIPLGLEITERTFAWSESFRDDFIIYEYTIKNVGIDSDADDYPDTPQDLQEFYFTYRLDADVSKRADWDAEMKFSNQDDLGACNAFWGWIEQYFPAWWAKANGFFTAENADSSMMFMWDADNPDYHADNGQEDDTGNPGADGTLQSPGFICFKVMKTDPPEFRVSSFHQNHIYNDPATDQEAYDRMMASRVFEGPVVLRGVPYPYDYRAILTLGPLDQLAYGDSVVITAAIGVGVDVDSGGVYSLMELVKIMDVAQLIIDNDYNLGALAAPAPNLYITNSIQNGTLNGLNIIWDNSPESNVRFRSYKVWKSSKKTESGAFDWKPLGEGHYVIGQNNPPAGDEPGTYKIFDADIIRGFDYAYAVQSVSYDSIFQFMESNINANLKVVTPANPATNSLDRVKVVPNPYIGSAVWNNTLPSDSEPWEHRLQFINLPADATIKIFTLDGDLVDEIRAGEGVRKSSSFIGETGAGVAEWDLITRNNQEAAPGIYLFVVQSPCCGEKVGKFVIVR